MILLNGYALNEALTVEPIAGDAAEEALFKRFCPARYDETTPEYKKRQELLKANPGAKVPAKSYKYGDTVIKWYRAAKAKNDAAQLDELTANIQSVEDLFDDYEQAVAELKREGKMPETVGVNGRNVPAGDPTKFRMLSGFKAVLSELKKLSAANKKFLDPMEPNDLDRKNIRLCFVEDGIAVWKTKYFKTTNKFIHQMWDRAAEQMAKDDYGNPDLDSPYCTRMTGHWKQYSKDDPEYSQFWFFKVVPGVDYVPGDLDNPGTYKTFKKLFKTGPNILMLAGSNDDWDDRHSRDFSDGVEFLERYVQNKGIGKDFGGMEAKLAAIAKRHFKRMPLNSAKQAWWENYDAYVRRKNRYVICLDDETDSYGQDPDIWRGDIFVSGLSGFGIEKKFPRKVIGNITLNSIVIDGKNFSFDQLPVQAQSFAFSSCECAQEWNAVVSPGQTFKFDSCDIIKEFKLPKSQDGTFGQLVINDPSSKIDVSRSGILANVDEIQSIQIDYVREYAWLEIDPKGIKIEQLLLLDMRQLKGDWSKYSFKKLSMFRPFKFTDGQTGFPRVSENLRFFAEGTLDDGGIKHGYDEIRSAINSSGRNCDIYMRSWGGLDSNFLNGCQYRKNLNVMFEDEREEKICDIVLKRYANNKDFDQHGLFNSNIANVPLLNKTQSGTVEQYKIKYGQDLKEYIYFVIEDKRTLAGIYTADGDVFEGSDNIDYMDINIIDPRLNLENVYYDFFENWFGKFKNIKTLCLNHQRNNSFIYIQNIQIERLILNGDLCRYCVENCSVDRLEISKLADARGSVTYVAGSTLKSVNLMTLVDIRVMIGKGSDITIEYNDRSYNHTFFDINGSLVKFKDEVGIPNRIHFRAVNSTVELVPWEGLDTENDSSPLYIDASREPIKNSFVKADVIEFYASQPYVSPFENVKLEARGIKIDIDEPARPAVVNYMRDVMKVVPSKCDGISLPIAHAEFAELIKPGSDFKCIVFEGKGNAPEFSIPAGVKIENIGFDEDIEVDEKLLKNIDPSIPIMLQDDRQASDWFKQNYQKSGDKWIRKQPAANESMIREWMRVLGKIR